MSEPNQTFAELRRKLMEAYTAEFRSHPELAGGGQPQIVFQALYAAALVDVAAELVIDAGMSREVFRGIADESYSRGANNAPRFG